MAEGKITVSVSVERAIHKAFEDMAERIWEEHKVRLYRVSFNWYEEYSQTGILNILQSCEIDSKTYRHLN